MPILLVGSPWSTDERVTSNLEPADSITVAVAVQHGDELVEREAVYLPTMKHRLEAQRRGASHAYRFSHLASESVKE